MGFFFIMDFFPCFPVLFHKFAKDYQTKKIHYGKKRIENTSEIYLIAYFPNQHNVEPTYIHSAGVNWQIGLLAPVQGFSQSRSVWVHVSFALMIMNNLNETIYSFKSDTPAYVSHVVSQCQQLSQSV